MKARTLILALVIVPLLFALPGEKMKAAAGWDEYWDVYEITESPCLIGPYVPPTLVGQWHKDCDGEYTGWGQPPTYACPYRTDFHAVLCE